MSLSAGDIANQFYGAFVQKDIATLDKLYHPDLQFSDPAFGSLTKAETIAMWSMLFGASDDLKVTFSFLEAKNDHARVAWVAKYSFGRNKRQVINRITADLIIEDQQIISHQDRFDLHKWARQALGLTGLILGWSGFFKTKLQRQTKQRLRKFMATSA